MQGLPLHHDGPFTHIEWFQLLEKYGSKPLITLAKDKEEAVALPLLATLRGATIFGNWYNFTWQPLATPKADHPSLLSALAKDLRRTLPTVHFDKVPEENGASSLIQKAFSNAGWTCFKEASDTNHYLALNHQSYSDYLASRPGQLRSTLKRKAKHVETEILTFFDSVVWQSYEKIYSLSWKGSEGNPALLKAFARQQATHGQLRLGLARHEGQVVAAQFWTVEGGTAYIHKLAHNEAFPKLSAGTILTAALMRHVIDIDAVEYVDFGTGNDAYKADWMSDTRSRFRIECYNPSKPKNWVPIARQYARKLVLHRSAG
nr:GNAT family N-acetyltransferase [Altericroceibacterium indicum]